MNSNLGSIDKELLISEQVNNSKAKDEDKFIYLYVNVRFSNIQSKEDKLVDTLGLYAIRLPAVRYHFHNLNTNGISDGGFEVSIG